MSVIDRRRTPFLRLAALCGCALLVHGYHLGVEDAEIYIPTAKKLVNPRLYPFAIEFFESHGHLSLFSPILAWTSKLTHLPMDWTIFLWYIATLFAMIVACWTLASASFTSSPARWSAVTIATAVLTMPATNTGLLLIDPYLTARSLSTPLTLFTIAAFLEKKYARAAILTLLTAAIHPQMVVYLIFLCGVIWLGVRSKAQVKEPVAALAAFTGLLPTALWSAAGLPLAVLPSGFHLAPATGAYREALYSRDYFFLYNWAWYHWLGMLAPLAILAFFAKANLRGTTAGFKQLSFALLPFGALSILAGLAFCASPSFDMFARLQPLRSFHLITIVFVLFLAGVLGEYLAVKAPLPAGASSPRMIAGMGRDTAGSPTPRFWIIAAIAIPLAAGMFLVSRLTYTSSPQVEFPFAPSSNGWVSALLWVRRNTPEDAVFAVDSRYFKDEGTDTHGFRAVSERSDLADYFKDGGVVSLFPALAPEWKSMADATYGLNHFTRADFDRLQHQFPVVSWTVVHGQAPSSLDCPYQQRGYAVCHLNPLTR